MDKMIKQTAFVCKRNYALYVDSIIKSDTTLQQRFHCLEAMLGTNKVSVYFQIYRQPLLKSAFKKDVFDSPLWELDIISDLTFSPEIIPLNKNSFERPVNIVLSPIPRDIPQGEALNSDSLSLQTEYDYHPLSVTGYYWSIINEQFTAFSRNVQTKSC